MLSEELLAAWLRLCSVIDNQRLVSDLSFNEAQVCGLLARAGEEALTAKDLCVQTRILKSQMNAILQGLERQGLVERRQSQADRRRVEVRLRPEGQARYEASHRQVLALVDRLVAAQGREAVRQLIPLLRQTADTFDTIIHQEV